MPVIQIQGPFVRYSIDNGWSEVDALEFGEGKSQQEFVVMGPFDNDPAYGPLASRKLYCYLLETHEQQSRVLRGYFNPNYTALVTPTSESDSQTDSNNNKKKKGRWFWEAYRPNAIGGSFHHLMPKAYPAENLLAELLQKVRDIKLPEATSINPLLQNPNTSNSVTKQDKNNDVTERVALNWMQAILVEQQIKKFLDKPTARSFKDHSQMLQAGLTGDFTHIKTDYKLYSAALMLHEQFSICALLQYGTQQYFRVPKNARPMPTTIPNNFFTNYIEDIWNYIHFLLNQEIQKTNQRLPLKEKVLIDLVKLESDWLKLKPESNLLELENFLREPENTLLKLENYALEPENRKLPADLSSIYTSSGTMFFSLSDNTWDIQVGLNGEARHAFLWLVRLVSLQGWFQNFPKVLVEHELLIKPEHALKKALTPNTIALLHKVVTAHSVISGERTEIETAANIVADEFKRFLHAKLINDITLLGEGYDVVDLDLAHLREEVEKCVSRFFKDLNEYFKEAKQNHRLTLTNLSTVEAEKRALNSTDVTVEQRQAIINTIDGCQTSTVAPFRKSWHLLNKREILRLARALPQGMQDTDILEIVSLHFPKEFFQAYIFNIVLGIQEHYRLTTQRISIGHPLERIVAAGVFMNVFNLAQSKYRLPFEHDFIQKLQHAIVMAPNCFAELFLKVLDGKKEEEFSNGPTDFLTEPRRFKSIKEYFFESSKNFEQIVKHAPHSLLESIVDLLEGADLKDFVDDMGGFYLLISLKIIRIHNENFKPNGIAAYYDCDFEDGLRQLQPNDQYTTNSQAFLQEAFNTLSDAKITELFAKLKLLKADSGFMKYLPVDVTSRISSIMNASAVKIPMRASQDSASPGAEGSNPIVADQPPDASAKLHI